MVATQPVHVVYCAAVALNGRQGLSAFSPLSTGPAGICIFLESCVCAALTTSGRC
jgi:hypothetical protein